VIEIRAARPADAEAIAALAAEVQTLHARALPRLFKPWSEATFPPGEVRELIAASDWLVLVASADSSVVGYATAQILGRDATPFRHQRTTLFVQAMCVNAASRRRGVGRALMGGLRAAAAERGITSITLDVWDFNAEAREFYETMGFQPEQHILSLAL